MKKIFPMTIPFLLGAACLLPACKGTSGGGSTDSTAIMTAKNKQTALNAILSINKHDADGVMKDCSADFVDYNSGDSKPEKLDTSKAELKLFLATFPDVHGENIVALAQGDTVAVMANWTGTFKGAMGKIQPTGKSFKIFDEDIFTFDKDGKITSHRSIIPFGDYMTQVGAKIPPSK